MIYFLLLVAIVFLIILWQKSRRKFSKMKQKFGRYLEYQNSLHLKAFINSYKSDNRPIIIYVVDSLVIVGGVETRMEAYCRDLTKSGYWVVIVSSINKNLILQGYDNCCLDLTAANASESLLELVAKLKPTYLEFHFKFVQIMKRLDMTTLRSQTKIGCVIHNVIDSAFLSHFKFDYICVVSELLRLRYEKELPQAIVIPNSVANAKNCYLYPEEKPYKAIIISRICKEKQPTLEAFIAFCREQGVTPYLGGPCDGRKNIKKYLSQKYQLKDENFLGVYDLQNLVNEPGKYLFVGGVGQAVMEAGILGYPVFLTSHLGLKYSLFLTSENFSAFLPENMTIKRPNIYKTSTTLRNDDFQKIIVGKTKEYNLNSVISKNCAFDQVFAEYLQLLKNCA